MKIRIHNVVPFLLVVFMASCSPKLANKIIVSKEPIFYPQKSDTARIQYLTSYSNSIDITGKQSAFKSSIVGAQDVQIISKPYGVSIKHGKIYVCDVTLKALEIIDLETKSFKYFTPQGRRKFGLPLNSFIDNVGNIYTVDTKNQSIKMFDANLQFKTEFGADSNINPTDIFIKNNKIYVVDSKNNRVNIYKEGTNDC